MQVLRLGDRGAAVAEVRSALAGLGLLPTEPSAPPAEAVYDLAVDHAVRSFQQRRGLLTDGRVGHDTYRALKEASYRLGVRTLIYQLSAPMAGDDVGELQSRLLELGYDTGRADGLFGVRTDRALRTFQREYGLAEDGIFGPTTMASLNQLGRKVTGGSPHRIREEEAVRVSGRRLRGKRIVIDPGHGGDDPGVVVMSEGGVVRESELAWDLAARLEGRLSATGVEVYVSRPRHDGRSDLDRAAFANELGADLVISLHADAAPSAAASGVATFHFGTDTGATSAAGELLAGYIQREIVARTGLADCRSHGRSWELLRRTRMPAVHVELGYLTNDRDRALLGDPAGRDVIADALVVAVKRLYLLGEDDQPTGSFTFEELLAVELSLADPA
ncbi:N-acetylmuramoyl-L-alanine amidase [Rhodococcus aerolatus]